MTNEKTNTYFYLNDLSRAEKEVDFVTEYLQPVKFMPFPLCKFDGLKMCNDNGALPKI